MVSSAKTVWIARERSSMVSIARLYALEDVLVILMAREDDDCGP